MHAPTHFSPPPPFAVIDETDDYLVVDKPALLQVHPSKPGQTRTLWDGLKGLLAFEIANGGQVSIINRLDRETSGLTLVCKHSAAARHFSQLMARRLIEKEYLAIVFGWPEQDEYEIDAPILRQGSQEPSKIYLKQMVHPRGVLAHTQIRVERRFTRFTKNGEHFAVLRARPLTGRMHQIRVHLAHVGHPVVGDKIYGPNEEHYLEFIETGWTPRLERSLLLRRHALHSTNLAIPSEGLTWKSPPPADMQNFAEGC